jgi:hypothetical protein
MTPQQLRRARDDVGAFARLIDHPFTAWQAAALALLTTFTTIVAPRQTGKSRSLSLLALWWAFRRPGQSVLIVSASEDAARRLLGSIRNLAAREPLRGSVVDENASLLVLSNGSTIRSVAASERAVRGWTVDLLLLDEAAMISDELLAAALPTTAARPEARVVAASSPWGAGGWFHEMHLAGRGDDAFTTSHVWRLRDAPWISDATIAAAKATLSPQRFAAEYEGTFVGAADSYFDRDDLLACTADYWLLSPTEARGEEVTIGVDWGKAQDAHAVVALGVLEDYGANEHPVIYLAWGETRRVEYVAQVERIVNLCLGQTGIGYIAPRYGVQPTPVGTWHETGATVLPRSAFGHGFIARRIVSETNGVGAYPTEQLAHRLPATKVVPVHTSQQSKEDAYGRLRALLAQRRIVLPNEPELHRQLLGLRAKPTASGGLTIEAATRSVHDDYTDALSLAVSAIDPEDLYRRAAPEPEGVEWVETPAGIEVPLHARPRRHGLTSNRPQLVSW